VRDDLKDCLDLHCVIHPSGPVVSHAFRHNVVPSGLFFVPEISRWLGKQQHTTVARRTRYTLQYHLLMTGGQGAKPLYVEFGQGHPLWMGSDADNRYCSIGLMIISLG